MINSIIYVVSIRSPPLKVKNISAIIFAKYLDYINIFFLDSATVLPKYTDINNHFIGLANNKQPSFNLSSYLMAL